MASVNKVILVGHLGKDPETRHMPNGDAVTNISIATTETWQDKQSGEKKEQTEWHRVIFFRKLAEIAGQYLKKGSLVYIEGRLQTRKWADKDGIERYTTEIVADKLQMLGGGPKQDDAKSGAGDYAKQSQRSAPKQAPQQQYSTPDHFVDDDIPF